MTSRRIPVVSIIPAVVALVFALPALAQAPSSGAGNTILAPDYAPAYSADIHTPEVEGRPGVYFFGLGSNAYGKGDYAHAIDMYKVAASWAYKPAEYNLGLMYFRGQGVPVDRPLGAAWMVLAAERGTPLYVKARDAMVTVLTKAQFAETDQLWAQLRKTYGDKVALRRAKAQWAWVKDHETGTRVGGAVGELRVGVLDEGHTPRKLGSVMHSASGLLQRGSIDGSIAYRQFQQSDDPYDPIFLQNPKGYATVEPLQPIKTGNGKPASGKKPAASHPQQSPRNA